MGGPPPPATQWVPTPAQQQNNVLPPPPPRPPRCPTRVGSLTHHVRNCVYTHCWMPHATWERREGGQPRVVACCVGGCGGWPPLLDILNSVATPPWHPSPPPPSPRSPPMDSTLCGTIIRSYRGAMRWPHPPARARGNQAYCHVWACWGAQSTTTHRRPPNARPSRPLDPGPTLCPSAHDCILDCVYSQGLGRLAKPRPTSAQVAHPGHHQSECAAVCSANTRGTSRRLWRHCTPTPEPQAPYHLGNRTPIHSRLPPAGLRPSLTTLTTLYTPRLAPLLPQTHPPPPTHQSPLPQPSFSRAPRFRGPTHLITTEPVLAHFSPPAGLCGFGCVC